MNRWTDFDKLQLVLKLSKSPTKWAWDWEGGGARAADAPPPRSATAVTPLYPSHQYCSCPLSFTLSLLFVVTNVRVTVKRVLNPEVTEPHIIDTSLGLANLNVR